jgi:hypothetical protein
VSDGGECCDASRWTLDWRFVDDREGWSWLSEIPHRSSVDIGVVDRVVASEAY